MKKLALFLVVVLLASCCSFAVAEDKVEISYTSWALAEESLVPIYGGAVDAFMADNPDVVVDYSRTNPYADYLTQLKKDAYARTAPYVAHIKAEWLPELLELGVVKDIKPYISEEVLADYTEATIAAVTEDDAMVSMPWFGNSYALYVNTALMAQAGIENMPATWDELLEDARKISALGDDIYGLAIPNSNGVEAGEGYNILPVLWAYGAEWNQFTTEEAVKAFQCIKDLIDEGVSTTVGNSFKDLRRLFGEGKIGFYWDLEATIKTAATAAENEEEFYKNFAAIEIPGTKAYAINHFLVVFDNAPDEVMPAIGRFLEYMSGAKVIDIYYKGGQGKVSGRASVNPQVFVDVSETTQAYVDAMTHANPLPIDIHFMELETKVVDALTMLAQGTSAEDAAAALQEAFDDVYDE